MYSCRFCLVYLALIASASSQPSPPPASDVQSNTAASLSDSMKIFGYYKGNRLAVIDNSYAGRRILINPFLRPPEASLLLDSQIYEANRFASHSTNVDVETCWPWYVPAEFWELNISASSMCQEMFERWNSISLAWQIILSVEWRMLKFVSFPFCIFILYISINVYFNFYA